MKTAKELARGVIFPLRTVFIEKFPMGYSAKAASGGRFTHETDKVQSLEMVVVRGFPSLQKMFFRNA